LIIKIIFNFPPLNNISYVLVYLLDIFKILVRTYVGVINRTFTEHNVYICVSGGSTELTYRRNYGSIVSSLVLRSHRRSLNGPCPRLFSVVIFLLLLCMYFFANTVLCFGYLFETSINVFQP